MNSLTPCLFEKMLNITKTASCFVIRTTQQIDSKPMHTSEKLRQNLLVTLYFIKDFSFLIHVLNEAEENFSLGFLVVESIVSLKPCHVPFEAASRRCLCF